MDIDRLLYQVSGPDHELFQALADWKNSRPLSAVELALVQVAFTSIYRDRTGAITEHQWAIDRLRAALLPSARAPIPPPIPWDT